MTSKQAVGSLILVLFSIFSNRIHAQNHATYGMTFPVTYHGQELNVQLNSPELTEQCKDSTAGKNTFITDELRQAACSIADKKFDDVKHQNNSLGVSLF